ncbi:unnamed protein product [Orchesella dallaii]|uniref:Uncharacterized protein n=1 Tax=Orchesella dallaii TaxID=48710 RepID=A0ABP1RWZ8_9HEXA
MEPIEDKCTTSIFPKLPFLLEDHEDTVLKAFFANPKDNLPQQTCPDPPLSLPLSIQDRIRILTTLLERVQTPGSFQWWIELSSKARAHVIIFLSENAGDRLPWSTLESRDIVKNICNKITSGLKASDVEYAEEQECEGLSLWFQWNFSHSLTPQDADFHIILQLLRKKLKKVDWKYFPVSAHAFGWLLKQIQGPNLSDFVDLIIPPCLLFTDDYYDDYKLLGLECMLHVVQNADRTDLLRNNWANVMYDAVQRLCTDKDPLVIQRVMSILMNLLGCIEKDPSEYSAEFTKYDDLMKTILFQMEFRSDVVQKRIWLPIFDNFLQACGTAVLHWSDRICGMLKDSTVCNDPEIWISILQCTSTVIKNTWMNTDCESIAEIILRVVLNVSSFNAAKATEGEKQQIFSDAANCLILLQQCEGFSSVETQIKEITKNETKYFFHPEFITKLKICMTK